MCLKPCSSALGGMRKVIFGAEGELWRLLRTRGDPLRRQLPGREGSRRAAGVCRGAQGPVGGLQAAVMEGVGGGGSLRGTVNARC